MRILALEAGPWYGYRALILWRAGLQPLSAFRWPCADNY